MNLYITLHWSHFRNYFHSHQLENQPFVKSIVIRSNLFSANGLKDHESLYLAGSLTPFVYFDAFN